MTHCRVTEEQLGEALLRHDPSERRRGHRPESAARDTCLHEDRFWELARGTLDPELTGRILDHVVECADCALALRVAHETLGVSSLASLPTQPRTSFARAWRFLAGSLLRPAPAFVYLVLLLVSFPVYRQLSTVGVPENASADTGLASSPATRDASASTACSARRMATPRPVVASRL